MGLDAEHPPHAGEEHEIGVGGGVDEGGDVIPVLEVGPDHALAASALGLELVGRHRLDVAGRAQAEHQVLVVDQRLDVDLALVGHNLGAPLGCEGLPHLEQLLADDGPQLGTVGQDGLQLHDQGPLLGQFVAQLLAAELGEPAQRHVEDVVGLDLAELELLAHERGPSRRSVLRRPDGGDDRIDHVHRPNQALQDVLPAAGLVQAVLGAAAQHLLLVVGVGGQTVAQRHCVGHAIGQRHHVHREAGLQRRVLVQVVEHHQRGGIPLQLEHQLGLALGRLVVDLANAINHPAVHQIGHLLLDDLRTGLIRNLGDHDAGVGTVFHDLGRGPHLDGSLTGVVGVANALKAHDAAPGGEVRPLHELHQALVGGLGILQQVVHRVDDLAQVVGRDVGGHAHGDPLAAVHQQVGKARREHHRLLLGGVEVVGEVHRLLVDAVQQSHSQLPEAALGVPHGRGGIVGRPEVAVGVDQRMPQREALPQAHQRVIDGLVTVGVVLAHDIAHHSSALHIRAIGAIPLVVHAPQDAAVNRLEPVAHIGERPGRDDRHGVVEKRLLHLGLDVDVLHGADQFGTHTLAADRRLVGLETAVGLFRQRGSLLRCPGSGRLWRWSG